MALSSTLGGSSAVYERRVISHIRTYNWPPLQLNFWIFVMLLASASILGVFGNFIQIQNQLNLPVPWYVLPFDEISAAGARKQGSWLTRPRTLILGTFHTTLRSLHSPLSLSEQWSGSLQIGGCCRPLSWWEALPSLCSGWLASLPRRSSSGGAVACRAIAICKCLTRVRAARIWRRWHGCSKGQYVSVPFARERFADGWMFLDVCLLSFG